MNIREGVIWAYRLILNRDPSDQELEAGIAAFVDPQALRRSLRTSREFATLLDRAGEVFQPRLPVDWHEGALWAFRLLLRREPSDAELHANIRDDDTVNGLRLRLLTTREFEVGSPGGGPMTDFAIVNAFAPFPKVEPVGDGFRDIFGSITRVRYLDPNVAHMAGYVYRSIPREREPSLHGTSEWVGTLRSVLEARDSFTAMELGAGWGPWLVVSQAAARLRGIDRIDLTGVEGSADHHGFMIDNFRNNGLDPADHHLHHAVAGAEDGIAVFPKLHVAEVDYGASAVFDASERTAAALRGDLEEIPSLSLQTIIGDKPRVDLIHIDIQGHEEPVISAGIEILNARVRRLVIGTHSRTTEGHLIDLFHANGWVCESEMPCLLSPMMDGSMILARDGEQVWRNDRLDGTVVA